MENYSLLNKKLDPTSSFWRKKYTLLLKRAENVEKQNLRLINRLYQIKRITRRLTTEKKFLMKRLDGYGDDFRNTKFYVDCDLLPEGSSEYSLKKKSKKDKGKTSSNDETSCSTATPTEAPKPLGVPPRKPMSAFFRYCQAQHLQILQENSGMSHDEIKKNLLEKWSGMTNSEKDMYHSSFEEDRDSYEKEMNQFLSNFKVSAETSGISHSNEEDEEYAGEEIIEEVEEENEFTETEEEKIDDQQLEKIEEEQFNSSLSDEPGSLSSDDQNDDVG